VVGGVEVLGESDDGGGVMGLIVNLLWGMLLIGMTALLLVVGMAAAFIIRALLRKG